MLTQKGTYKGFDYETTYSYQPNQGWNENHKFSSVIFFPKNNEVVDIVGNAITTRFALKDNDKELSSWEEIINAKSAVYLDGNHYYTQQQSHIQALIDKFINISNRKELPVTRIRFVETLKEFAEETHQMNRASFKIMSGDDKNEWRTRVLFNTTKAFNKELINSYLASMGITQRVTECIHATRYASYKRYSHELVIEGYVFASSERMEKLKQERRVRRIKMDSKESFRRKGIDRGKVVAYARSLKNGYRHWLIMQGKNADDYEVVITFRKKEK